MKNKTVRSQAFTLLEYLTIVAIVAIVGLSLILGIASASRGCINWSHGTSEKIGQVVKFGKQGFIRDTWEGQLIRGGLTDGNGVIGTQPFNFTVEGEELAARVQKYMREQAEVRIVYRIEGLFSPFRSESHGCFLTLIEPLKPEK